MNFIAKIRCIIYYPPMLPWINISNNIWRYIWIISFSDTPNGMDKGTLKAWHMIHLMLSCHLKPRHESLYTKASEKSQRPLDTPLHMLYFMEGHYICHSAKDILYILGEFRPYVWKSFWKSRYVILFQSAKFDKILNLCVCNINICHVGGDRGVLLRQKPEQIWFIYFI